jgi:hypothetical protein
VTVVAHPDEAGREAAARWAKQTIFSANGDDDSKEGIRAVLNAGFERRATVPRCMVAQCTLTEFRVFCPKAFAGIGKLPDTVADRSIPIVMARRTRGERIGKFRNRDAEPIAEALETWSADLSVTQQLHADEIGDRAADICEPLLAIADMAGANKVPIETHEFSQERRDDRVAFHSVDRDAATMDDGRENEGWGKARILREKGRSRGVGVLATHQAGQ